MKGSATMNRVVNESPYGVLDSDRERIIPTKIAMAGKKSFVSGLGSIVICWPSTRSTLRLQPAIFLRADLG